MSIVARTTLTRPCHSVTGAVILTVTFQLAVGTKSARRTFWETGKENRKTLLSTADHVCDNEQKQVKKCSKKQDVLQVSPLSQCAPVQPRPQVQLPVATSHTPPLLQLQRWRQSAPNQPGGQPEGRTHTLKLKVQFVAQLIVQSHSQVFKYWRFGLASWAGHQEMRLNNQSSYTLQL